MLTTAYWIALVVGAGLLVVSSVLGGDADAGVDLDVDADVDVDVDADTHAGHAHAGSLATWFSMQFLVFFLAMFGAVGVVLTYLSAQSSALTFGCAVLGGILVGQGAHQVLRALKRTSGDSTPKETDYINKLARVTVGITGSNKGEIALQVGSGDRFVAAVASRADDSFSPGDHVGVVAYRDGLAEVVSRQEYEFINQRR
jgi:membrane protein implicated in regulation of membrane protease activity